MIIAIKIDKLNMQHGNNRKQFKDQRAFHALLQIMSVVLSFIQAANFSALNLKLTLNLDAGRFTVACSSGRGCGRRKCNAARNLLLMFILLRLY